MDIAIFIFLLFMAIGSLIAFVIQGKRIFENEGDERITEIAFLCGILALLGGFSVIGGLIAAIPGIILGSKVMKRNPVNVKRGKIGLAFSIFGIAESLVFIKIYISLYQTLVTMI